MNQIRLSHETNSLLRNAQLPLTFCLCKVALSLLREIQRNLRLLHCTL